MDSATRQLASQNNIQTSSCGIWGIIITTAIAIYAKIVGPSDSSRFAFSILATASHVSASALKQLGFVEFPLYASANAINKNPNAIICIILTDFIFYVLVCVGLLIHDV